MQGSTGNSRASCRFASAARQQQSEDIATAVEKIRAEGKQGQLEWIALLQNAESLLDLCRATKIETLSQPKKSLSQGDSLS